MSAKPRYFDERVHRFAISRPTKADPTLVICPRCNKMAKVFPFNEQPEIGYSMRVACTSCSFVKDKIDASQSYYWYDEDPTDSYFKYPLWLKTSCCGESLWAFNERHLKFLENFVSAELREREQNEHGWANSSLASRLPKWIQAAKCREKIKVCLVKLRELGGY